MKERSTLVVIPAEAGIQAAVDFKILSIFKMDMHSDPEKDDAS